METGSCGEVRAELLRKLPFETEVVLCEARHFIHLTSHNPFGTESSKVDVVRFVSILAKAGCVPTAMPITFPPDGEWLVRLIACKDRFVFGEYRRHMKTISYLGQIDKLFGGKVTTRNWNTMMAMVRILEQRQV